MPAAAEAYDVGAKACAGAKINTAANQFPRAAEAFNTVAERLGRLMEGVRNDLTESGEALVKAANGYSFTDAHEAAAIRRLIGEMPPPGNFAANSNYNPPSWLSP
jgi:hypothetical protein